MHKKLPSIRRVFGLKDALQKIIIPLLPQKIIIPLAVLHAVKANAKAKAEAKAEAEAKAKAEAEANARAEAEVEVAFGFGSLDKGLHISQWALKL